MGSANNLSERAAGMMDAIGHRKGGFGVHVGPQNCTMEELRRTWAQAELLGFDWVSVWDHFYASQIEDSNDCFEAVACHAALAAVTGRVRVGCLVYSAGYRHPAVLAKAAITIDHLSSGRLELGIGAGWHESEYRAFGIPFESPATRLRRLREYVLIVRALLSGKRVDLDGEFWTLREAQCSPGPFSEIPRLWIGANGPAALRQAGEIGDGLNTAFLSPRDFAERRRLVLDHAPDPDRFVTAVNLALVPEQVEPFAYLRRRFGSAAPQVSQGAIVGPAASWAEQVDAYKEAGADWIIVAIRAPFDPEAVARFADEVLPVDRASDTTSE